MSATAPDAIVIGAGHNGLVCAASLARRGRRVLVLEARDALGGGAGAFELAPGYRAPACAHLLHGLHAGVVADLELARHGFVVASSDVPTLGIAPGEAPLLVDAGGAHRLGPAGPGQGVDGRGLAGLRALLADLAAPLAHWLARPPPRLATRSARDGLVLARLGLDLRGLGAPRLRELLRVAATSAADLLAEHVTDPHLAGILAVDAVAGTRLGPRSPGSVLSWLHRAVLARGQGAGTMLPRGGMGALIEAIARAAREHGASLRTAAPVTRIVVEGERVRGVELESGERLAAPVVVSTLAPARTLIDLVGAEHLQIGLSRALGHLRARGAAAKLDLALDGLPDVADLAPELRRARFVLSPSVDALERAFDHVKYGEHSAEPALEIVLPSAADPDLAPPGGHVLSATVLYAADQPRADPDAARQALQRACVARLDAAWPGLAARIVAAALRTPADLERECGLGGGHWHHVELGFDQLFWSRPLPALARHTTPVAGLFLGGAGSHPGGGVTGLPGANAARAVLASGTRAGTSR